jgi:hypothetical protein
VIATGTPIDCSRLPVVYFVLSPTLFPPEYIFDFKIEDLIFCIVQIIRSL